MWISTQQVNYWSYIQHSQILGKKWEYNETVYQLVVIDLKKLNDSFVKEVLYNILTEFGISVKMVRLIKVYLTEMYSSVRVGKNLSDTFHTKNGVKQGDALSLLLFKFALEYAIRRVTVNHVSVKLKIVNGTHQLWFVLVILRYLEGAYLL